LKIVSLLNQKVTLWVLLNERLQSTIANDRRMLLNEKVKDEDLICNYLIKPEYYTWGSSLRITPSEEVLNIPDNLFKEQKIELQELDSLKDQGTIIYKSHFYFLMTNEFLIVTLPGNVTISRFKTYINWFLEDLRKTELFEFTPDIKESPIYQLRNLKKISVSDPIIQRNNEENSIESKRKSLSLGVLKGLFSDISSYDETSLSEIVSAELLLKFKKPNQMTKQDYQSALGAYLKPISDTDNITFHPKSGQSVKGTEILNIKEVFIEKLESNNISENQLMQQMELFMRELK
jgi:hypothetical protein